MLDKYHQANENMKNLYRNNFMSDGFSILMASVLGGNLDLVEKAVEKFEGNVNELYNSGSNYVISPITVAIMMGNSSIVNYLLSKIDNPNIQGSVSLVGYAVTKNNLSMMNLFLQKGAFTERVII